MVVKFLAAVFVFLGTFCAEASPPLVQTLLFKTASGLAVQGELIRPGDIRPGERLPAIMVFGGFETKGVLALLHPHERVILASFDYLYAGPRTFHFPQTLMEAPALKRGAQETLEGILALSRTLHDRADVDPQNITLVGASFGSPFAVFAAAHESTIRRLVLVHGFADLQGTLQHRLDQIFRARLGALARPASWVASHLILEYLDPPLPENEAPHLRADQRVLMIEAKDDRFIPSASRERLWKALQASPAKSDRIVMPGDHLQPGADALIEKIMAMVTHWISE